MTRAAIYARFSSDLQRDRSVDDQIALCRELCGREQMKVVKVFTDKAISGASTLNRPGFLAMMRAATAKSFDVIVAEDVDRLSRDQADYHAAVRDLNFLGIGIHTASGKVTRMDGALRALMGEMFLENLAVHTRRGLEAVIRDGRHAGGHAYGYRAIAGKPGELEIVTAEANVVRKIFRDYVAGKTPRTIAGNLNQKEIPAPRGKLWNASTINGSKGRGGGILQNEIYVGEIVWNKVRMIKDPATGKRISRINDPSQIRRAAAPHLRIVDEQTWNAARARKAERAPNSGPTHRTPRVFSGLLKCGSCGGGLTSVGKTRGTYRLQCATHRESGACENGRKINRDDVEAMALQGLKSHLMKPRLIAEFVTAYNAERKALAETGTKDRDKLERRAGQVARELQRAVDAIVKAGVDPMTLAPQIKKLEAERDSIAEQLAAAASASKNVVRIHPHAVERYRTDVERLALLLANDHDGDSELLETVRRLVRSITVFAEPGGGPIEIEIKGRLAELIDLTSSPRRGGTVGSERGI